MASSEKINEALKRYWGYDVFRPKQEEIVRNILDGRDVCVVTCKSDCACSFGSIAFPCYNEEFRLQERLP